MENNELKLIKKKYGEKMMHLCRDLFPTLLEQPNLVYSILEKNIAPTKSLSTDIIENNLEEEFKNYIYSFIDVEQENITTNKTPSQLLKEKGYILYECKTEEEIQSFKKYYRYDEELCTFRNNRLNKCHVFFAVKENVEEIKRDDFEHPKRQDEYGTSVISIQFSKGEINTLSIKNRYNHTVNNPDATFSNNLENIIPGLTNSFEKYYGLNINQERNNSSSFLTNELQYVTANNKYYRYNYEINNIYYCENNIIIDNGKLIETYSKEKERYILIDYFIIDKKEKTISLYDNNINDSFIDSINDIEKIKDIISTKDKIIVIEYEDNRKINITINKQNRIISYKNNYIKTIENKFLYYNKILESIELPRVEEIGNDFLYCNEKLIEIELPEVKIIGNNFLYYNGVLESIELMEIETIGNCFLHTNGILNKIELPKVKTIGDDFLSNHVFFQSIELPKVEEIGNNFLYCNEKLIEIELPEVKIIGNSFLVSNEVLEKIKLPKVEEIRNDFLYYNEKLIEIELPEIKTIGDGFLCDNELLEIINLPKAEKIGNEFLYRNRNLEKIELLKVKKIGNEFLYCNRYLEKIELPKVKEIGNEFLCSNIILKKIKLLKVEKIRDEFLYSNKFLEKIELPKVEKIGNDFLCYNEKLIEIELPEVKTIGDSFLFFNKVLEKIELPKMKKIGNEFLYSNSYSKIIKEQIKQKVKKK